MFRCIAGSHVCRLTPYECEGRLFRDNISSPGGTKKCPALLFIRSAQFLLNDTLALKNLWSRTEGRFKFRRVINLTLLEIIG